MYLREGIPSLRSFVNERNSMKMNIHRKPVWIRFVIMVAGWLFVWLPCNPAVKTTGGTGSPLLTFVTISGVPLPDAGGTVLGATIPLKRAGRLFVMEGTVNGISGNFILDTGAAGLVLNKTYFRNSIEVSEEEGGGVTGNTAAIERLHVTRLTISELTFSDIPADVMPLGHLENRRGVKILGLFGMSLLQKTEMVIDLRNNEWQVHQVDRNGNRLSGLTAAKVFDIESKVKIHRNIAFLQAQVAGKTLDFCLDTGAESNLLHSSVPKQVMAMVTITRRSTLRGSGPAQGDILMGTLREFKCGARELGPMTTAVCNLSAMSGKYGFPIDGMLGYDFFVKGKICLNMVKKEFGITLYPEELQ